MGIMSDKLKFTYSSVIYTICQPQFYICKGTIGYWIPYTKRIS